MKRIIILFISIFVLLIVYVSTPSVSEEQMRTLFYEYIQRTFKEEYKKFKIISDVDLTVPGNQYHRGYAGYGKTYSIEYVHKEYKWIFIELCTNGNNIVCDNKNNIKKEFKYNKIFNEYFINAFKIVGVEPVGIIVEMNGSINEYEHVDEIKPNLEFIIKNPKYFKPQIKVNTSLVSLKEFEKLAEANPNKVQLIAINVDGDKVDTKAVVAKRQLTLPVIKDQLKITAERYQLIGTPTSFVITPEGNIQAKYEGAIPAADLDKLFKG